MIAHVVDTQTQLESHADTGEPTGRFRYRWRCACGDTGRWQRNPSSAAAARRARDGGARHTAIAERSKP